MYPVTSSGRVNVLIRNALRLFDLCMCVFFAGGQQSKGQLRVYFTPFNNSAERRHAWRTADMHKRFARSVTIKRRENIRISVFLRPSDRVLHGATMRK